MNKKGFNKDSTEFHKELFDGEDSILEGIVMLKDDATEEDKEDKKE